MLFYMYFKLGILFIVVNHATCRGTNVSSSFWSNRMHTRDWNLSIYICILLIVGLVLLLRLPTCINIPTFYQYVNTPVSLCWHSSVDHRIARSFVVFYTFLAYMDVCLYKNLFLHFWLLFKSSWANFN